MLFKPNGFPTHLPAPSGGLKKRQPGVKTGVKRAGGNCSLFRKFDTILVKSHELLAGGGASCFALGSGLAGPGLVVAVAVLEVELLAFDFSCTTDNSSS